MDRDILDAPRYCTADTARLVGLSPGQVRRYLRGYTYKNKATNGTAQMRQRAAVTRHSRRDSGETYASFLDLVDLLVVRRFLERRFSLQQIRRFIEDVWSWSDSTHIANERFFTLDKSAFVGLISASGTCLQELGKGGQTSLLKEIHVDGMKIEFETRSGLALRWFPTGKSGLVMVDPRVSFGRPVLKTLHIPTSAIYDLFIGENKDAAAVGRWYRIDQSDVEAAVDYEHRLVA